MKYEEAINLQQKIILINQVIDDLNNAIKELEEQEKVFNELFNAYIEE